MKKTRTGRVAEKKPCRGFEPRGAGLEGPAGKSIRRALTNREHAALYAQIVGAVLTQLRERDEDKGVVWSQSGLALAAGMSQSRVSRIESGRATASLYELRNMTTLLGVTSSQLIALIERAFERAFERAEEALILSGSVTGAGMMGLASFVTAMTIIEMKSGRPRARSPKAKASQRFSKPRRHPAG